MTPNQIQAAHTMNNRYFGISADLSFQPSTWIQVVSELVSQSYANITHHSAGSRRTKRQTSEHLIPDTISECVSVLRAFG